MTVDDALKALAHHPHLHRYRELCAEDNPDVEARDGYRRHVIELASGATVDAILAAAKAEGIPESIEPRQPCGGC